jgi:hypothetical protein
MNETLSLATVLCVCVCVCVCLKRDFTEAYKLRFFANELLRKNS